LEVHVAKIHKGDRKPWKCKLCTFECTYPKYLAHHMENMHEGNEKLNVVWRHNFYHKNVVSIQLNSHNTLFFIRYIVGCLLTKFFPFRAKNLIRSLNVLNANWNVKIINNW